MSRKQFIESVGATCSNWSWSWSFVNKKEKFVVFSFDKDAEGDEPLILSKSWVENEKRRSPSYHECLRNIDLVQNEGYKLKVFGIKYNVNRDDKGNEIDRQIKSFDDQLQDKVLRKNGNDYFAVN